MAARCSEPRAPARGARRARVLLALLACAAAGLRAAEPDGQPAAAGSLEQESPGAPEEFAARRADLQGAMERLRADMERFETEERSHLARLERLRLEAALREQELAMSDLERSRLERAVDRLRFQVERVTERLQRRRAALAARLRALYRRGPLAPARALGSGADSAEWLRAVGLLEHLSRREAVEIEALRSDNAELQRTLEEQRRALHEREQERRRAEASRAALARAFDRHRDLLEALRSDRDTHRAAYDELATAARELDTLITRVEGGERVDANESTWASLGPFRGLLSWPVEGSLRVPFGDVRHPRFGTLTPHRGLSFAAPRGAGVRAVFEGEVVYQDWLRGYGHTVILNHHHGYLSVYAHLAEPQVRAGQRVPAGAVLGQVGESGSLEGPQLYFELRRDALPLDPEPWLAEGIRRADHRGGRP